MFDRKWSNYVLLFVGFIFVSLLMVAPAGAQGDEDFCTLTSKAAKTSCEFEVQEEYWIFVGNCYNLSDSADREECMSEAEDEREEALEECDARYAARLQVCSLLGEDPYDPDIDPADFVDPSDIGDTVTPNPYLPLIPGTTWIYEGGDEVVTVTVSEETKEIMGVTCVVVLDVVEEDGEVLEDTEDWYAQDVDGNVWYFGEISQEFEDGELIGTEGSWKAGRDGAKPGILVEAAPAVGSFYRQEFLLGEAEDVAKVLLIDGSANAPLASCRGDCLVTKDYTPIEPGVWEYKYYAPGVGLILEVNAEDGARVELVDMVSP